MEIIGVIIAGIIIGLLGKFVAPGDKDNIPLWLTILCGIGGVILGWFVYTAFGGDGSPGHRLGPLADRDRGGGGAGHHRLDRDRPEPVAGGCCKPPSDRWVRSLWGGRAGPSPIRFRPGPHGVPLEPLVALEPDVERDHHGQRSPRGRRSSRTWSPAPACW